jgi:hypothetical protein
MLDAKHAVGNLEYLQKLKHIPQKRNHSQPNFGRHALRG